MATMLPDGGFINEIPMCDLQHQNVLGRGSYGTVKKAIWHNQTVAVKIIDNDDVRRKALLQEITQLSRLHHQNIIKLFGCCQDNGQTCGLVMEYSPCGSLEDLLHKHDDWPTYTAGHVICWAIQTATGLAYLHNLKPKAVAHRDLKPANLLLFDEGRNVKICDFGTVCDVRTYMSCNKGTVAWMAPEVFETDRYNEKCDVFSFGTTIWEMMARKKPFEWLGGPSLRVMWAVHNGQRPPSIEGCPKPLDSLMKRCWEREPSSRPSMLDIIDILSRLQPLFPGADTPVYPNNHTDPPTFASPHSQRSYEPDSNTLRSQLSVQSRNVSITRSVDNLADYTSGDRSAQPSTDEDYVSGGAFIPSTPTHRRTSSFTSVTDQGAFVSDSGYLDSSVFLTIDECKQIPVHLQPVAPVQDSPESMRIYIDHCRLSRTYLDLLARKAEEQRTKDDLSSQLDLRRSHDTENDKLKSEFLRLQEENGLLLDEIENVRREVSALQEPDRAQFVFVDGGHDFIDSGQQDSSL